MEERIFFKVSLSLRLDIFHRLHKLLLDLNKSDRRNYDRSIEDKAQLVGRHGI